MTFLLEDYRLPCLENVSGHQAVFSCLIKESAEAEFSLGEIRQTFFVRRK